MTLIFMARLVPEFHLALSCVIPRIEAGVHPHFSECCLGLVEADTIDLLFVVVDIVVQNTIPKERATPGGARCEVAAGVVLTLSRTRPSAVKPLDFMATIGVAT